MATTVGTSDALRALIANLIRLERDALAAYDVLLERLEDAGHRERVSAFRGEHARRLDGLVDLAVGYDAPVPAEGDAKEVLTTGKVRLAGLVGGDGALLKAMGGNESDMAAAYRRAADDPAVPDAARPVLVQALEEDRRHGTWMKEAAEAA